MIWGVVVIWDVDKAVVDGAVVVVGEVVLEVVEVTVVKGVEEVEVVVTIVEDGIGMVEVVDVVVSVVVGLPGSVGGNRSVSGIPGIVKDVPCPN